MNRLNVKSRVGREKGGIVKIFLKKEELDERI